MVSAAGLPPGWNLQPVLPGCTVRLDLSATYPTATDIVWMRDLVEIGRTGTVTHLDLVNFRDPFHNTGSYYAKFQLDGEPLTSAEVILKPTPFAFAPLLNLSSRATLSPPSPHLTSGFVIARDGVSEFQTRQLLVRASGPSLSGHGVSNALPDPSTPTL
ncbi:MAG: hypothetical protein J6386_08275 [Candidatus Synoicihabitans palmerolidicus]|nr:hypothetical protein [Candidatus Synoicihabitans palmerolidicus]